MNLYVNSIQGITPAKLSEFNIMDDDGINKYEYLVVENAYSKWGISCDVYLSHAGENYIKDLTLTQFKRVYEYIIMDLFPKHADIEYPLEVQLENKRFIRGQSTFMQGYSNYNGACCDTRLEFAKVTLKPIE